MADPAELAAPAEQLVQSLLDPADVLAEHRTRRACPVCGSHALTERCAVALHLGVQVPANVLVREFTARVPRYPLTLLRCPDCGHACLRELVPDDVLFPADYPFRSAVGGAVFREEALALAQDLSSAGYLDDDDAVLEIGCNDGTVLRAVREISATADVLGVDPAAPAEVPVPVIRQPWPDAAAALDGRTFRVILAQNVLGHVVDPLAFLAACRPHLAAGARPGVLIVEVPSLLALLRGPWWDSIYHEHRHYWSALALRDAAQRVGLAPIRLETTHTHGPSLRVWFAGRPLSALAESPHSVRAQILLELDAGLHTAAPYRAFADAAFRHVAAIVDFLIAEQPATGWVGLGASAKGHVLLQVVDALARQRGTPVRLERVCDDTPSKQGRYLATAAQVRPFPRPGASGRERPACVVLSWNHEAALAARARATWPGCRVARLFPTPGWIP